MQDIECHNATLDAVRRDQGAIMPSTQPFGVSNDFMMSRRRHPFFKQLIDALPAWNRRYGGNYATVMFSTGPAFVDFMLIQYLRTQLDRPSPDRVHIMHPDLYAGRSPSYFRHHPGSSWHAGDANWLLVPWNFIVSVVAGVRGLFWR